jgi:hypothetical protein
MAMFQQDLLDVSRALTGHLRLSEATMDLEATVMRMAGEEDQQIQVAGVLEHSDAVS